MKSKSSADTHAQLVARARECLEAAKDECADFNASSLQEALDDFEAGEVAQYFRENGRYCIGLIVTRLKAIEKGVCPEPVRAFDKETLIRLLSTRTQTDYAMHYVDVDLSNLSYEEVVSAAEAGTLVQRGYVEIADTPATTLQRQLGDAVCAYARAAASYARHVKSESLLSWAEMLDVMNARTYHFSPNLSQDEAVRLFELEKAASLRLRLDRIIAELPSYKCAKGRRGGKKAAVKKGKVK